MKVRKYLLICIAAISLNALTACGGGSTQSDPLDPENPENPEPPVYFNPIEGEWIWKKDSNVKNIFTENFEWKRAYFEGGKWSDYEDFRTYKMIDDKSFIANNLKFYFTITREGNREIMNLMYNESDKYPLILYRTID